MTLWRDVAGDVDLRRQLILTIEDFRKGGTAPTDVTVGSSPEIPAFRFDATDELISLLQVCPFNWDKGDIDIILIWGLVAAQSDGDQLSVTMDYTAPRLRSTGGGVAKASTQATNDLTVTTAEGLAVGDLYDQVFTLDALDATNPLANAFGIDLDIHLTNLNGVAAADFMGACINFTSLY